MHERVYLLDCWRLDHVEAVRAKEVARHVLHVLPRAHVSTEEVLGSLNPLCHVVLLPRPGGASGRGHKRRVLRAAFRDHTRVASIAPALSRRRL